MMDWCADVGRRKQGRRRGRRRRRCPLRPAPPQAVIPAPHLPQPSPESTSGEVRWPGQKTSREVGVRNHPPDGGRVARPRSSPRVRPGGRNRGRHGDAGGHAPSPGGGTGSGPSPRRRRRRTRSTTRSSGCCPTGPARPAWPSCWWSSFTPSPSRRRPDGGVSGTGWRSDQRGGPRKELGGFTASGGGEGGRPPEGSKGRDWAGRNRRCRSQRQCDTRTAAFASDLSFPFLSFPPFRPF